MIPGDSDPGPASARTPDAASLVDDTDVRRAVEDLFDAGSDNGLVIRVYGESGGDSADAIDTFREMLASLKMHDDNSGGFLGTAPVQTPDRRAIGKALTLLGDEAIQRSILDHVLTTFGRSLIDPLGALLDRTPEGTLMGRLTMLRDIFLAQITGLHLTKESQQILSNDVRNLLGDKYLAMVADNEEKVQRPRVRRLAQQLLQLVGLTFRGALRRWPSREAAIVDSIYERLPEKMMLKAIPPLVKSLVVTAIQNYLWEETSGQLETELVTLFREHEEVVRAAPGALKREAYVDFAEFCWTLIEKHC